jgi:hypothetical protein
MTLGRNEIQIRTIPDHAKTSTFRELRPSEICREAWRD